MAKQVLSSVELVGDGDEVAAIEEVEAEFDVVLPAADASKWITAGDVYASLKRVLPADAQIDAVIWQRFAAAICRETGVDPKAITPASRLMGDPGFWSQKTRASASLWLVLATGLLLATALSLMSSR